MKLSKQTINILKNYAGINSNILIQTGSKLSTIAVMKNIMSTVDVEEKFPSEFGIFNLQEFLGVVGLMNDPEFEFDEKNKCMYIKEAGIKVKYTYASKDILTYPQKDIKFPNADVSLSLTADHFAQLQKAAGVIGVQDVAIVGNGKKILINILDKKNPSTNEYSLDVDAETDKEFVAYFKIENLKQIADDYDIDLSSKNIARFVGKENKVTYYIAMEPDSKFS